MNGFGPLSDEPREHVHEFGDWVIVGRTERRTCACGVYNHRPHPRRSVSDEPRELEWRWGSGEWLSTKTANGAIWTISEGHSLSVSADKYGRTTGMKDHGAHFDLYRGFENRDGDEYNSQGFVKEFPTLDAAKSLAASLQSVLDGRPLWTRPEISKEWLDDLIEAEIRSWGETGTDFISDARVVLDEFRDSILSALLERQEGK